MLRLNTIRARTVRARAAGARGALVCGGLTLGALVLGAPGLAAAEDTGLIDAPSAVVEAEELAEQAFEAYSEKRYSQAIALYEHAFALAPSADALYNIARIYDLGLRDRERAIAAYERFLTEPGASAERIERAGERMNELLRAERAELDARAAAQRPSPGSRGSAASAASPASQPSQAAARDGEPDPELSSLRVGALVVGGVGVASALAGGAFGLSVLSQADTANAGCDGNRCTTQRSVDAARTASTHATLATVGVSVGAGLLATSAVLWIIGGDGSVEEEPSPGRAPLARLRMAPIASASELGLALAGGF